ncbi:MAG: DUF349 domain-containing protein, partial [Fermentimonas sp.]|nr:DUF349 domain-containing protein [Fermentimonas sp.]HBT85772.1 DUF349 domain-containing protein [Porphyromonadaceae bacterium]
MNTTNNLENEKLSVNEVESDKKIQSEITEQEISKTVTKSDIEPEPELKKEQIQESVKELEQETVKVQEPEQKEETDIKSEPEKEPEAESVIFQEKEIDYDLEDAHEEDESDDDVDDIGDITDTEESNSVLLSIEDIIKHLRNLLEKGTLKRKNVEEYKNQFYRSLRNEIETQKHAFLSDGGEEIDFVAAEPEIYTEGKDLLQKIKEKRAELVAKEDAQKEKNVARKLSIINQIKILTETQGHEDFNKTYQEFKSLQQEWNEIKLIPQSKVNELWKSYQRYVEK